MDEKVALSEQNIRLIISSEQGLHNDDFVNADLQRANLIQADLRHMNLSGANLTGANFEYADLECATLRGANLKDCNFFMANLKHADLRGADLRGVDFSNTDIRRAKGILSFQFGNGDTLFCFEIMGDLWFSTGGKSHSKQKAIEQFDTNCDNPYLGEAYTVMIKAMERVWQLGDFTSNGV